MYFFPNSESYKNKLGNRYLLITTWNNQNVIRQQYKKSQT